MASQFVIPMDPTARKNLWRDWIRHDPPQAANQFSRRLVNGSQSQPFDLAQNVDSVESGRANQYRIDPKPRPTWQWVASLLLLESAILMLGWKILIGV